MSGTMMVPGLNGATWLTPPSKNNKLGCARRWRAQPFLSQQTQIFQKQITTDFPHPVKETGPTHAAAQQHDQDNHNDHCAVAALGRPNHGGNRGAIIICHFSPPEKIKAWIYELLPGQHAAKPGLGAQTAIVSATGSIPEAGSLAYQSARGGSQ